MEGKYTFTRNYPFSRVAVPFYIPTCNTRPSPRPCILANSYIISLKRLAWRSSDLLLSHVRAHEICGHLFPTKHLLERADTVSREDALLLSGAGAPVKSSADRQTHTHPYTLHLRAPLHATHSHPAQLSHVADAASYPNPLPQVMECGTKTRLIHPPTRPHRRSHSFMQAPAFTVTQTYTRVLHIHRQTCTHT